MVKKMGFWLLAATLLMSGFSREALAADGGDGQESVITNVSKAWINPMYEGIAGGGSTAGEPELLESQAGSGPSGYVSVKKASAYMCSELVKRSNVITVRVQSSRSQLDGLAAAVFEKAVAVDKNTPGREGDYIFYHVQGYHVNISYYSVGKYTLTYTVSYLTTKAQESKVTARVNSLLSSLGVAQMSAYGKIKTIYDYICKNVSYDYEGLNDSSVGKFSAYNALFMKKAVCQGYASLFYRMAVDSGVSARVIPGTSRSEPHAWNIVKLGSSFYHVDSTWDAGKQAYGYFLKNNTDFSDHVRDASYQSASFQKAYPISSKSYQASGKTAMYSLAKAKVSGVKNKIYNGKEQTQKATLKMGGATLKQNRDYKVSYKNNVKAGTATIIFTGKGSYSGTLKKNYQIVLKKGSVYKVKAYRYRITNNDLNGRGTVCLLGGTNQAVSSVKAADTVNIGGKKFKVTYISAKAFKNYKQLQTASIGTNVVKIGDQAFCGDTKLKSVVIKSRKLKFVGKKVFSGIHKNADIRVDSQMLTQYKTLLKNKGQSGNVKLKSI